jgi:hypothetical protein
VTADAALEAANAQAAVVGSDLVRFATSVSPPWHEDLIKRSLFAQLWANAEVANPTRIFDWYDAYFGALHRCTAATRLDGAGPGLCGVCRNQPELLRARGGREGCRRPVDAFGRLAGAGQVHARCLGVGGREQPLRHADPPREPAGFGRALAASAWPSTAPMAA